MRHPKLPPCSEPGCTVKEARYRVSDGGVRYCSTHAYQHRNGLPITHRSKDQQPAKGEKTMNASRENARRALKIMDARAFHVGSLSQKDTAERIEDHQFVRGVLEAAAKTGSQPFTPQAAKILVVGPHVWGKGDTLEEALKNARKPKVYTAYIIHPNTVVTGMGDLEYPIEYPPKAFAQKAPRKVKQ